ncbi:MAG: hypothetical protein HZA35_03905 [Parcubacteria group bacterium]|nr:hypothetical protein [Parcubacteria group bacterium]
MSQDIGLYIEQKDGKIEVGEICLSVGEPILLKTFDSANLSSALAFVEDRSKEIRYEAISLIGFLK